jgi:hypothetical protein
MVKYGLPDNLLDGSGNDQQESLVLEVKPGEDVILDGPWFLKADFDRVSCPPITEPRML